MHIFFILLVNLPMTTNDRNNADELRKILQNNIKALRKQRGFSQQKLAETSGLSLAYIGGIEIAIKSPSFDSLCAIANALDVQVYQLFLSLNHQDDKLKAFSKDIEIEFQEVLQKVLERY